MDETSGAAIIVWIRRDFRLDDHRVLAAAAATGRPVIPVFLFDELAEGHAAAPRWRYALGAERFAEALAAIGSRLILRRGAALACLRALLAETGAGAVWWQRAYDPAAQARDRAVKAALKADGVAARSFAGALLAEPWEVSPAAGGFYKVFTPFWKSLRDRDPGAPLAPVTALRPPAQWPASDAGALADAGRAMDRGAAVVRPHLVLGEAASQARLDRFLAGGLAGYAEARDLPGADGASGLSESLAWGEISPRRVWSAVQAARAAGVPGAEAFLRQLGWRAFAWHLLFHCPGLDRDNWRPGWHRFPWNQDGDRRDVLAWKQGRTGYALVDAGMREMQVTGRMHNRARMVAASFLTKHLLTHWRVGLAWFEAHLADWDPAANALGWQWVAGSGPDAAPYFRIFNPDTQARRFDPAGAYTGRWLAEGRGRPEPGALAYYQAIPRSWGLAPGDPPPDPVIGLAEGRKRALEAYARLRG